jgi:diguanylate cyclase (GGDEF)-like protein/PAS domain S-box-containing protein
MEQTAAPLERGTDLAAVQRILAARAHSVAQHVDKAIYTLDPQWRFSYLNPAAERLMGRRWEDLVDRCVWDEFPDLAGSELESALRRAARTLEHSTFEMFHPPTGLSYEIHVFADELGVTVCFGSDQERRRRAAEATAATNLTRTVLEQLPLPVVVMEADGTILAVNRRWMELGQALGDRAALRVEGGSYLDTVRRTGRADDAAQLRERLGRLASGDADEVRLDLRSGREGEDVWLRVHASRVERTPLIVVTHTDVTSHVRAHRSASWEARHDHLTQLPNRAHLHDLLTTSLQTADRQPVTLLFIDVDEFKAVNDRLGHDVGDDLLRAIARRLVDSTRAGDTVARLGGDEFVVVSHPAAPSDAHRLVRRLRAAFEAPFALDSVPTSIGVSIGVATADGVDDVRQLLRRADLAMYDDKHRRRHRRSA